MESDTFWEVRAFSFLIYLSYYTVLIKYLGVAKAKALVPSGHPFAGKPSTSHSRLLGWFAF
jgi:hypothetical protein